MGNVIKSAVTKIRNFFKKIGSLISSVSHKEKNVNNNIVNNNQFFDNFTKENNKNIHARIHCKIHHTNQSQDKSVNDFIENDNEELCYMQKQSSKKSR